MADIRVKIEGEAFLFVNHCVQETDNELGGFFSVEKEDDGLFIVDQFYVLEQEVSPVSVGFDGEALNKWIETFSKEGGDLSKIRGSWHSHNSMESYFSYTDIDAIERFHKNNPTLPWLVSLVFNHDGEIASRVDVFDSDALEHLIISDVDVTIKTNNKDIIKRAKAELGKLKTIKKGTNPNKLSSRKKKKGSKKEAGKKVETVASTVDPFDDPYGVSYDTGKYGGKRISELTDEEWEELMEGELGS